MSDHIWKQGFDATVPYADAFAQAEQAALAQYPGQVLTREIVQTTDHALVQRYQVKILITNIPDDGEPPILPSDPPAKELDLIALGALIERAQAAHVKFKEDQKPKDNRP